MNRFMRMIVLFDLPVQTKKQRHAAASFRNFLLKDGYTMLQYSVYVRVCNGLDAVQKNRIRLYDHLPDDGSARLLVITEKQFASIEILLGTLTQADQPFAEEQITIL